MNPNPSPEGAALDQLRFLEETLRRSRQRYADVQSALLDANNAFEQAKRTRHTLTTEAESLDAGMAPLVGEIRSLRVGIEKAARVDQLARVRRLLARFPDELLRCIFVEAMQPVEDIWGDDEGWGGSFYGGQARIPFVLSSVNRKWREVALLTPHVWTFIAVGPLDDCGRPHLAYVKLLLSRSKRRPLDVFLGWANCEWTADSVHYAEILDTVGRHTHRWRRASITLPSAAPESASHFLRSPMPALEDLLFCRASSECDMYSASDPSTYLPFCPSLRRFVNTCLFAVPISPLAALTLASITVDSPPLAEIWTLIGMLPAVRHLILDFIVEQDGPQFIPAESVTMPHLRHLALLGHCEPFSTCVAQLQMPFLEELYIDSDTIGTFSPLFERVACTLCALVIRPIQSDTSFPAAHMSHIRKLQKLRALVVRHCNTVGPSFATVLASREASGLPLLERVTVRPGQLSDDGAARIASLMHKLHARSTSGTDGALAFELAVEDDGDVPAWLLRQYKFITTGECDSDSEGGDAADREEDPSGLESESDAEFTDGGSGESYTSDSDWQGSESDDGDSVQESG